MLNIECDFRARREGNNIVELENYQALLWWIFQMGKFLREKATLIKSEILK